MDGLPNFEAACSSCGQRARLDDKQLCFNCKIKMKSAPPPINPKREALAQAARILRRNKSYVIALYAGRRDVILDIENEYHEIIHDIEMQIVDLDKQTEGHEDK